ncbi:hypothetical protein N7456_004160 [Penicillium angulare]|uniref:Cation transporter n=1 Tax=Penicillium angulare TaxID=116970 RepID=A0A9W9FVZ3_9EURO|nr:hypothetical protein N7456_004160 [Penicillium angulare]
MARLLDCNPLTLHYVYFIAISVIGSVIIYMTSMPISDLQYADASFMSFSAMTGTGLNVVSLSSLTAVQQGTIFTLFILGHAIPILGVLSFVRGRTLCSIQREAAHNEHPTRPSNQGLHEALYEKGVSPPKAIPSLEFKPKVVASLAKVSIIGEHEPRKEEDCTIITDLTNPSQIQQFVIADEKRKIKNRGSIIPRTFLRLKIAVRVLKGYLSWKVPNGLPESDEVECRALFFLSGFILLYFITFLSFGILILGLSLRFYYPEVPLSYGVSPFWAGAFLATSAFVNNGMSLIDTDMAAFQRDFAPLLICSVLILAGNTLFPCLLRLFIWSGKHLLPQKPKWQIWRQTLDFALENSQKVVCSSLYPTWHTWFLLGTILVLNSIMWGAFELASIQDEEIRSLPGVNRALDGLFQSLSVRGGGFSVVAFSKLPQGLLILYVSAAIGRSTKFSEKHQKDISSIEKGDLISNTSTKNQYHPRLAQGWFLYQQLRSQFSHDIWWLSLTILFISIAESDHYKAEPVSFSTFNIIFEVVSAYSCVGASIGYPGKNYAFCGEWHTFSKILLLAVSLKGRLRGVSIAMNRTNLLHRSPTRIPEEDLKL